MIMAGHVICQGRPMVPQFLFPNRAGSSMLASHPKHGGFRENLMIILIYLPTMSRWAVIMRFRLGTKSNYQSAFRRMQ
jgi:hypothetical protein